MDFCETIEAVSFCEVLSKDSKSIDIIKIQNGIWTDSSLDSQDLLARTYLPNCKDIGTGCSWSNSIWLLEFTNHLDRIVLHQLYYRIHHLLYTKSWKLCQLTGLSKTRRKLKPSWTQQRLHITMRFNRIEILTSNWDEGNGANQPVIGLLMYGDGSKMEEGLGAGVFCDQLRMAEFYKLDRKCRVFCRQRSPLMKAAELINTLENEITEPVAIYVGSQEAP